MTRLASLPTVLAALTEGEVESLARAYDITGLRITVAGGVPVVEGEVPCYRMKRLAAEEAARLLGAAHVINRLRVVPQGYRPDRELSEAVRAALDSDRTLVEEAIGFSVCDGVVALEGSVSSSAVRCQAEAIVWAVGGVRDVENRLRVQRQPTSNGGVATTNRTDA